MFNMIKADSYRITKHVAFYVSIAIIFVMAAVSIYLVSPGTVGQANIGDVSTTQFSQETPLDNMRLEEMESMSPKKIRSLMLETENYELDREILGMNMNLYYCFIFIAAIIITVDFSSGSVKNTLSSAISRRKYFLSKTAMVFGICLLLFFLNTYVAYFGNLIFNDGNVSSDLWTVTKISLLQLPPMLALMSIITGIAFITKKTAVYNMITIPLVMVFQLVLGLLMKLFDLNSKIAKFEFQIMIGRLSATPENDYILHSYLVCAAVIIVFMGAGYLSFRKSEIK